MSCHLKHIGFITTTSNFHRRPYSAHLPLGLAPKDPKAGPMEPMAMTGNCVVGNMVMS